MILEVNRPRRASAEGPPKHSNAKIKYYLVDDQAITDIKNQTKRVTIYNDYR